jgi:hypothetical protein
VRRLHAPPVTAVTEGRPLDADGLAWRTAPFTLSIVLAFAIYPWGSSDYGVEFTVAMLLAIAQIVMVLVLPWRRLAAWVQAVPPFLFLAMLALLRDAHGGGASGYGSLVFVPVVWFALYGTRLELWLSIVASGLTVALPLAIVGSPEYTSAEGRRTIFVVLLAVILGVTIRWLVDSLRREVAARDEAERGLRELQAFEINDDVVQSLTVARMSLELGDYDKTRASLDRALVSAKQIIASLRLASGTPIEPGSFVREQQRDGP